MGVYVVFSLLRMLKMYVLLDCRMLSTCQDCRNVFQNKQQKKDNDYVWACLHLHRNQMCTQRSEYLIILTRWGTISWSPKQQLLLKTNKETKT